MRDTEKTIGNIIDKAKTVYISSVDEDGFPNTKAMLAVRKRDGVRILWFTSNTSSMRAEQYKNNSKACVYLCDNRFFRGVQLVGTMEVCEDIGSKEMIWRDGDEMYYPQGVTDPDYCVLKFMALKGRYYSNFKSENFTI